MKILILTFFTSLFVGSSNLNVFTNIDPDEVLNSLDEAFRSLDVSKIVSYINETVDIDINNGSKSSQGALVSDKSQAYALIQVFFNYHKVQKYYLISKGLNNGVYELHGLLQGKKKNFRLSLTLVESRNRYFIRRIEINLVES